MVLDLPIRISGIKYLIDAVVLRPEDSVATQPLILGRPWLRAARVNQSWDLKKDYIEVESQGATFRIGTKPMPEVLGY